jgi:hypothetical protein
VFIRTKIENVWLMANDNAIDIVNNIHLKEDWVQRLLKYFEDSQLPDFFVLYFHKTKESKKPSKTWISKHNRVSSRNNDVYQNDCYFGSFIQDTASAAKSFINMNLNVLWRSELPSGQNETGLLEGIRRSLKPRDAQRRATISVRTFTSRAKVTLSSDEINTRIQQKTDEFLAAMSDDWYPSCWLSFYLCGAPAGAKSLLSCHSGKAIQQFKDNQTAQEAIRNLVSRDVRRLVYFISNFISLYF